MVIFNDTRASPTAASGAHRFLCACIYVVCTFVSVCVLQRRVRRAAASIIIIPSACAPRAHPKIIKLHLSQWEAMYSGGLGGWMDASAAAPDPKKVHRCARCRHIAHCAQRLLSLFLKNLPLSYVQNSTPVQSAPLAHYVLLAGVSYVPIIAAL